MKYEVFDPEIHDCLKVANLIYDVDFRTYDLIFKSRTKAVTVIEKNLKKDDSFKVILDENEIIGILMYYTTETIPKFHFKSLKLIIIDILDFFVLSPVKRGDLYIAQLAIDSSNRGKGFGTIVLNDIISYANHNGFKKVTLDVDLRNHKPKALYEKMGFHVVNKKVLKIAGFHRGMYNMELNIS